jgi:hypothetical protein
MTRMSDEIVDTAPGCGFLADDMAENGITESRTHKLLSQPLQGATGQRNAK